MKRKRKSRADEIPNAVKRLRTDNSKISHPVLKKYYRRVTTLREYLLTALSPTSRQRKNLLARREISQSGDSSGSSDLLDTILVCSVEAGIDTTGPHVKDSDRRHYSQQVAESTGESIGKSQLTSQAEVGQCQ